MKQRIFLFTLLMMTAAVQAFAGGYNYVSPEKVKDWLTSDTPVSIVDIQVEDEFNAHHLTGSMATYSYPVKSDADKAKIDGSVAELKTHTHPVVIVCPRGKGGAKRCYDYLKDKGIEEDRLLILEKGMDGWPYKELVEKN